jgi:hypothetical protein
MMPHVRISKIGYRILNDRELARKVADAIIKNHWGKPIKVPGTNYIITSATDPQ